MSQSGPCRGASSLAGRSGSEPDAMRTFDFAPLYRSTVGFDRMLSMLNQLGSVEGSVPS